MTPTWVSTGTPRPSTSISVGVPRTPKRTAVSRPMGESTSSRSTSALPIKSRSNPSTMGFAMTQALQKFE